MAMTSTLQKSVCAVAGAMLLVGALVVLTNTPNNSSPNQDSRTQQLDISLPKVDVNHQDLEQSKLTCSPQQLTAIQQGMDVAAPYMKQLARRPLNPQFTTKFFGKQTQSLLQNPSFRNNSLVTEIIHRAASAYSQMGAEWKPECCDTTTDSSKCTLAGCVDNDGKSIPVSYGCNAMCSDSTLAFVLNPIHDMNAEWDKEVKGDTSGDTYSGTNTRAGRVHFCPSFFDGNKLFAGFAVFHELTHMYGGVSDGSMSGGINYLHSTVEGIAREDPVQARETAQNYMFYAAESTLPTRKDIETVLEGNDLCATLGESGLRNKVEGDLCKKILPFHTEEAVIERSKRETQDPQTLQGIVAAWQKCRVFQFAVDSNLCKKHQP